MSSQQLRKVRKRVFSALLMPQYPQSPMARVVRSRHELDAGRSSFCHQETCAASVSVDAQVEGFWLTKVLMDSGSSINILYAGTFARVKLSEKHLQASKTKFQGIIPGTSVVPLGRISLDIVFGSKGNFRKEKCTFEVIDFDSPFHALLGRPAYAKFMARPCYIYSLKMPGPKGAIIVSCNS
jgi:hypothetical protein